MVLNIHSVTLMMEIYPILHLCKDLAQFLLCTLHLLLTRILPLIALLVGSLLLHLIRFTFSFLFANTHTLSAKRSSFFHHRPRRLHGPPGLAAESVEIYEDALQESLSDHEGSASSMQEEWYEDCDEPDSTVYGSDEQLRWLQEEAVNQGWEFMRELVEAEVGDGERQVSDGAEGGAGEMGEMGDGKHVLQEAGDRYGDMGGAVEEIGDGGGTAGAMQEVMQHGDGVEDEEEDKSSREGEEVGDHVGSQGRSLISFPSDLPPTLDDLIMAAAINDIAKDQSTEAAADRNKSVRPLVPTFSTVAAALQESSASKGPAANGTGPTRTSSYDKFMSKFKLHFMLDGGWQSP